MYIHVDLPIIYVIAFSLNVIGPQARLRKPELREIKANRILEHTI